MVKYKADERGTSPKLHLMNLLQPFTPTASFFHNKEVQVWLKQQQCVFDHWVCNLY